MSSPFRRSALSALAATVALGAVATGPAVASPHHTGAVAKRPSAAPVRPPRGIRHDVNARASEAVRYDVRVHTGTPWGAGTDGDVWLYLVGDNGSFGWVQLDNDSDNFERNNTDYFTLTLPDLGNLTQAYVFFSGTGSDWYLDWVKVNDATFSAYQWLAGGMIGLNRA
jgi:hypothetical protein